MPEQQKIIPAKVRPLPPKLSHGDIVQELIRAHSAVAELRGYLGSLPNPDLLIAPFRKREAVASSAIEGTRATLEEVLKFEAADDSMKEPKKDESRKILDIQEVMRYEAAMNVALEQLKERPIGETLLRRTHQVLLDSVRGANKDRGNFRREQVMVGDYIPPIYHDIPALMTNWENYLNSKKIESDTLVRIGVAHYQFEAIHPFLDGNGRIGRLTIPLFLCQTGMLQTPVLYISHFLEEHKVEYQKLLHGVDTDQEWIPWLKFFLTAVDMQAKATTQMAKEIQSLYEHLKKDLILSGKVRSPHAIAFLDAIFTRPIFTAKNIHKALNARSRGVTYRIIEKFSEGKILEEYKLGRESVYGFSGLLKVLRI